MSNVFYISIQYRPGKSLVEAKTHLEARQLKQLGKSLYSCIQSLHENWGITHGDISPKNILFQSNRVQDKEIVTVTMVDWEFAEKVRNQSLSTYSEYRGTKGFSASSDHTDLHSKDWIAFEACK